MGWFGIANGRLLRLAQEQFDAFITVRPQSVVSAEPACLWHRRHCVARSIQSAPGPHSPRPGSLGPPRRSQTRCCCFCPELTNRLRRQLLFSRPSGSLNNYSDLCPFALIRVHLRQRTIANDFAVSCWRLTPHSGASSRPTAGWSPGAWARSACWPCSCWVRLPGSDHRGQPVRQYDPGRAAPNRSFAWSPRSRVPPRASVRWLKSGRQLYQLRALYRGLPPGCLPVRNPDK